MKNLVIIIFILSGLFSAFAKEKASTNTYKSKIGKFKVFKNESHEFYLQKMDKELNIMLLQSSGGRAGLKEVKQLAGNKDTLLIIYFAGSSGTKVEVNHFRAVLWSESKNRFIGDVLYKDILASNSKVIVESTFQLKNKTLQIIRNKKVREKFDLE